VVVFDEHEEVHQEEASPTWHARDVAVERAARVGAACVLTSPCPSLEALEWGELVVPDRTAERQGWPIVDVVDRAKEDPLRTDLYSPKLVELVRSGKRVVCVLNRKGRARLLACGSCGALARCERCGLTVAEDDGVLHCRACAATRPAVCLECGSSRLKVRRLGTTRAREDLERLAGVPVGEVTGDSEALPDTSVLVGTEAVLRRVDHADAVAFLDLDAELLAPRYRAAEQTMALVARAARIVGGKAGGGRLLLQTRLPRHEVVQAALLADPARVSAAEAERRRPLLWPPFSAMAHVSGAPAGEYVAALQGVQVMGPVDGAYLVRAPDHGVLCDALAAVPRPGGRMRVAVDPLRL
jgi:primosomal protein N' (replication factor Y)